MPQVKPREEQNSKFIDFEIPDGYFFAPLRKDYGKVKLAHPMDDDIDGMFKIINEKIIPVAIAFCKVPKWYGERIKELLQYVIPGFDTCFTFPVELQYLLIVPKEQQTKENLELAKILRIVCEIFFGSLGITDDITDESLKRMGKPAWYTICKGGFKSAYYDAQFLNNLAFHLLEVYFGNTPGYKKLVNALNASSATTSIGQVIDIVQEPKITGEPETIVNTYKAGFPCRLMASFGLIHAGVEDEAIIGKVKSIYIELFIGMQTWNDFQDTFSTLEVTGKNTGEDILNGRATWSCQAALALFNEEQKAKFLSCYGSTDERDIHTIKDLYNEINMPRIYLECMTKRSHNIDSIIEEIPCEVVKKACINIKEWFFGKI